MRTGTNRGPVVLAASTTPYVAAEGHGEGGSQVKEAPVILKKADGRRRLQREGGQGKGSGKWREANRGPKIRPQNQVNNTLCSESRLKGGGVPPSPVPTSPTLPQRQSHTPTPAPTAFPTASNRLLQPLSHPPPPLCNRSGTVLMAPLPFKQSPACALMDSGVDADQRVATQSGLATDDCTSVWLFRSQRMQG